MNNLPTQLPLALAINEGYTLDNFSYGSNGELLQLLQQTPLRDFVYIWGGEGAGKSHLLQALCQQTSTAGSALYLPLSLLQELGPNAVEGGEYYSLLAIDGPGLVAGDSRWEEALFHLYNRVKAAGGTIVVADRLPPDQLPIQLADLRSRLQWGPVFQLQPMRDQEKATALVRRAEERGLLLPIEVANYLLRYTPRNPHQLFANLEYLDRAALIQKRRLTIPFVRQALDLQGGERD